MTWDHLPLGDLAREVRGSVVPRADRTYELWSVPSFQTGTPELVMGGSIRSAKRPVEPGDVLLSKINPRINRVWLVTEARGHEQVASPEWIVLRADRRRLDSRFLLHYLRSPRFREWIEGAVSGVTGSHTRAKPAEAMRQLVPLPSLAEQRRTVDILEDHLSRLDAAEASISTALRRIAQLQSTILRVGLRGELVPDDTSEGTAHDLVSEAANAFVRSTDDRLWPVPETWAWVRLGDVFEVNVGATPPRDNSALWSGDLPWVSSGEVAFGRIRSTRERIARAAAGNPNKRIHPPGTVMLAMIGEGRTRGQTAVLDIEAAHNQNCASIRVSETAILPEFLYGYLEERYLETRRGGSGGQQPALNKAAIQNFAVPIAPLATQRALVRTWDRLSEQIEPLAHTLRSTRARNASLRRALLHAAFSGQLTGKASSTDRIEGLVTAV